LKPIIHLLKSVKKLLRPIAFSLMGLLFGAVRETMFSAILRLDASNSTGSIAFNAFT
jgi:hypothetical protein